jgi:Tat protein translocase TatB subunit
MNIGPGEILLLAIFALIFFGPKRLPEIGRQVGRAVAQIRRLSREFESEVRDATEPFTREVRESMEPIANEAKEIERRARETIGMDTDHSTFTGPPRPPAATAPPAEESTPD